jgi:peptidoglycan/LPS O-acetylase OafA/YrhL
LLAADYRLILQFDRRRPFKSSVPATKVRESTTILSAGSPNASGTLICEHMPAAGSAELNSTGTNSNVGIRSWFESRFEVARHGDAPGLRPMEGLRGFAVFLVFLVHFATFTAPFVRGESMTAAIASSMGSIGHAGVDLFFVLSGYLIYGSLIVRRQEFGRFMLRRIERIYPTFIVVLLAYLALSFALPRRSKLPDSFPQAVLYVIQNVALLPGIFRIQPIITVAWSLSYEMLFYLVVPVVIGVFGLRQRNREWRMWFVLCVAALLAAYFAVNGGPVRVLMFMAGMLLFEILAGQLPPVPATGLAVGFLLLGLLGMLIPPAGPGSLVKVLILCVSFLVTCLACLARSPTSLGRAFSWTPMRWLGNMSYSYYLIHGLTLQALFIGLTRWFPNTVLGGAPFWIILLPVFLVTAVPAAILFLYVEKPLSLSAGGLRTHTGIRAQRSSAPGR